MTRQMPFELVSDLLNDFTTLKRFAFIGGEGKRRRACMRQGLALAGDGESMMGL